MTERASFVLRVRTLLRECGEALLLIDVGGAI
jgi:hypothetical protein